MLVSIPKDSALAGLVNDTVLLAEENVTSNTNAEMHHSMRLFRAQRNFYIAGFAIFLILVIRRLVLLISLQATLLAQSQASMRQAESATTAARSMMTAKPTAPSEEEITADEKVSRTPCDHNIVLLYLRVFLSAHFRKLK